MVLTNEEKEWEITALKIQSCLFVCSALQTRHQVHPKAGRFSSFDTVLAYTKKIQQWIMTAVEPLVSIPRPKKCQGIITKAKRWFFWSLKFTVL